MMMTEDLASPRVVARLLRRYDVDIKRRLGQNFLVDGRVADRIVEALALEPGDRVLEIGPGLGVLTQRLLERADRVVAVEIDWALVAVLEDVLGGHPRLQVIHGDARKLDLGRLLSQEPGGDGEEGETAGGDKPGDEGAKRGAEDKGGGRPKAVGNLPYYATSPLLFRLLEAEPPFATVVVMVQREVADRMAASPGGKDYGALSVNVQYRCRVERILNVPPAVFFPRPEVHSAVVRLTLRPEPGPVSPTRLSQVVRAAFSRRRKTLRNALRSSFSPDAVAAALERAQVDGDRRPESLAVDEFARLAAALPAPREAARG